MACKFWRKFSTNARYLTKLTMNSADLPSVFLPPVNRSMERLDRAFFRKTVPLAAARISEIKNTQRIRSDLVKAGDLLQISTIKSLRDDPSQQGSKCFLLQPEVKVQDQSNWSPQLRNLVDAGDVTVTEYNLQLTYDDWSASNILEASLPDFPEEDKETPAGFSQIGHVAHVNLRSQYLPYKYLIGEVLRDKNPLTKTVINKTLDVGSESEFRTFPYEVLAGPDDLEVQVIESGCQFKFDFAKVYWNPRLSHEHERLVEKFKEGEAVCDLMAGVGPFAIPAGKKRIFVYANDLNPEAYNALQWAIQKNKVEDYVAASCADGREFIHWATKDIQKNRQEVHIQPTVKISRTASKSEREEALARAKVLTRTITRPHSFDHFVMNLPATAVDFLDAFRGIYHGRESEFAPTTERRLPMIHVHLFQAKRDTEAEEQVEICQRVSEKVGSTIKPDDEDVDLHYVRLVSPKKKMYCASFRLPGEVAFAKRRE